MAGPAIIINVDDHEPARYVKQRLLSNAGFSVYEAATGTEALNLVAQHNPDLVLLDVHLPDLNGIEVCRRIKSSSDKPSAIVLQISASAISAPQATAALDSGADSYLVEPIDPDVLISTIKALLRLRKAERELSTANNRLTSLNHELQRINQNLAHSNEDLQQFAYAASHDLQEPLRTVTSFVTLLEKTASEKLSTSEREYLAFISQGSRRMRDLINDLLRYAQAGDRQEYSHSIDLNAALSWALENIRESIAQSGAQITCDTLPSVVGDQEQLGQVFQNLISNAIKYAQPGTNPTIHVSASIQGHYCLLCVKDSGIGIADSYLKVIFSPFKRLHGKDIPGTGIGLAVCRRVIEAHGGKIWAESVLGQGSSFFFTLLMSQPPA